MITCHRKHLEARCRQRDYELADVMGCVVEQNGDQWTIDTEHPKYAHKRNTLLTIKSTKSKKRKCGGCSKKLKQKPKR